MRRLCRPLTARRRRRGRVLPAVVAPPLLAGLLLTGCSSNDPTGNDTSPPITYSPVSPSPAVSVAPAALLSQAQKYDGQRVTTTGTVRSLGPFLLALSTQKAGQTPVSPAAGATRQGTPTSGTLPSGSSSAAASAGGTPSPGESPQPPLRPDEILVINGLPDGPPDGSQATLTGTFYPSFDASIVEQAINIPLTEDTVRQLRLSTTTPVLITEGAQRPSGGT